MTKRTKLYLLFSAVGVGALAIYVYSNMALADHGTTAASTASTTVSSWSEVVADRGPIELESVVSARWSVPLAGLLNLDHARVRAAGIEDVNTPILLTVHVLKHPTHGVFVIDTGITRDRAAGGDGAVRGLVPYFVDDIEAVEPLGDILARQDGPIAGVFLTHLHLDHVLGLPDVPKDTPIYAGPGELAARSLMHVFLRGTYDALLDGRPPIRVFDYGSASGLGAIAGIVDVFGDGSLWALHCPGHTAGSTAFLANTTGGPVLFTGDTSHTIWGWKHGVEPGDFTEDHARNARSLQALKALVEAHPEVRVYVGHELDGDGTGVAAVASIE